MTPEAQRSGAGIQNWTPAYAGVTEWVWSTAMQNLDASISKLLDRISDYIASHRGAPVFLAVILVALNYVLRIIPGTQLGFVESTDLLLHLGIVIGLLGVLLGEAV